MCCIVDFHEHAFIQGLKRHLYGAGEAGARHLQFPNLYEELCLMSKMKAVVKYDFCLDQLRGGPMFYRVWIKIIQNGTTTKIIPTWRAV